MINAAWLLLAIPFGALCLAVGYGLAKKKKIAGQVADVAGKVADQVQDIAKKV